MVIDTRGSTSRTRSMVSVCTASPMATVTRDLGTKGRSRGLGCTRSGMAISVPGSGILGLSRTHCPSPIQLFSVLCWYALI